MPPRRSFRLAAQDLEAQFLELLARFRFDQGRADDGRNPDVRDELAMIDYLYTVTPKLTISKPGS